MVTIGEIRKKEKGIAEWLINDFFSLSSDDGASYVSPFFSFFNVNWFLEMYPNGSKCNKSEGYIGLFLHRKFPGPHIKMEYSLGVKTVDEKMNPEWHLKHEFKDIHGCGFYNFVNRTKIFGSRYDLLSTDVLTFVCKFKPSKDIEFASKEISILHESKVFQDYKKLFFSKQNCDVIIKVNGQEFEAHRIILAARSPVFESTFRNDMKEKRTGIVDIKDGDPSTFSDFLCFLYCGDTEIITVRNAFSLFAAADKYDVSDLRERCLAFVKENLSVHTFCETLTLALQYSDTELTKLSIDFFSKNGLEIAKTVKWQTFLTHYPTQCNELFIKAFQFFKDSKN